MKRTFIAVKIDAGDKLKGLIATLMGELKSDRVKWVDTDHLHITLAFLGDTTGDAIKQIVTMLQTCCNDFGMVNFKVTGIGIFRNIADPRVIWAGLESVEKLAELFKIIKGGLNGIGISIEEREFKPHLTLGRVKWLKSRSIFESLMKQFSKTNFQEVSVSEVIFYESKLQQAGPLYLPLDIARLN